MRLSIADRRAVMAWACQPELKAALQRDPRAVIADVTGHLLPSDIHIELIEEADDAFCFVAPYPGSIEAELPVALDARSMVENDVYARLRETPSLQSILQSDPKAFLRDELQIDLGLNDIVVRSETGTNTIIVIPHVNGRDELSDHMLDLVAGGGDAGCQSGSPSNHKTTPIPWG